MLQRFIKYLNEQAANHSIYVWGAQGQTGKVVNESWIRKSETSEKNAIRAIKFWMKQVAAGYGDKLRAFDCSGLGVCFLLENKIIKSDMSAHSLYKACPMSGKLTDVCGLQPGDFVFRLNDAGKAYHIGYIVDDKGSFIEARGRDAGVVKLPAGAAKGYWTHWGRPKYWGAVALPETWIVKRILKLPPKNDKGSYTATFMRGDDVKELQRRIINQGFIRVVINGRTEVLTNDGVFGEITEAAVKLFQRARKLGIDGKAGKQTINALGGVWSA